MTQFQVKKPQQNYHCGLKSISEPGAAFDTSHGGKREEIVTFKEVIC